MKILFMELIKPEVGLILWQTFLVIFYLGIIVSLFYLVKLIYKKMKKEN